MNKFDQKIQEKLSGMSSNEEPNDASVQRLLGDLDSLLPQEAEVRPLYNEGAKGHGMAFLMKIAAVLLVFAGAGYLIYSLSEVTVQVGRQARQEVQLPDGSAVTINSGSELAYNKLGWWLQRKVALQGEAFFEVTKGQKFEVVSPQGVTSVLGTSFNVFARKDLYKVKCHTGKVRVVNATTGDATLLTPGQAVEMKDNSTVEFAFQPRTSENWQQGEFYFEKASLSLVLEELERQYDVDISYPAAFKDRTYTGYFTDDNLTQALKLVCDPMELKSQLQGKKITLSQSGN